MSETSTVPAPDQQTPSQNGSGPIDPAVALAEVERATKRSRLPFLLLGIAVGVGAALAVSTFVQQQNETTESETEQVVLATAPVEQRDLIEEIEWAGTLGYGAAIDVTGGGGIVTGSVEVGASVNRGDVVAEVNAEPIVALFGPTPMWRNLSEGDVGVDVLQLESNLVVLGYDPDGAVGVDDTFTAATEDMVERWQEDLGVEVTGRVTTDAVVIIDGPSIVTSAADVGATANGSLVSLSPRRIVGDVASGTAGTITGLAEIGTTITHGQVLYTLDEVPVPALVDADGVATALTEATFTGLELEQALADGGHDPDGDMTVDGAITEATVAAIERWQEAAGLPITGQSNPAFYRAVPADQVVEAHLVEDGVAVSASSPALSFSRSRLSIDLVVDVTEADEFTVGQEVSVELADETVVTAEVLEIGPVVQGGPNADPTVDIIIGVTDRTGTDPVEGPVTVLSAGQVINGATVVPTRALVTLAEGGFAVERVDEDGNPALVGIELGNFDDGVVEVVEGDLQPGDSVVVPQ